MKKVNLVFFLVPILIIFSGSFATAAPYNLLAGLESDDLVLGGGAALSDNHTLRLTKSIGWQSTGAFLEDDVNVGKFSTYFQFQMTNPGGSVSDGSGHRGADGFVFVVKGEAPGDEISGKSGKGMGYQGIKDSIGVEFDIWKNSRLWSRDTNSNHIAINKNGKISRRNTPVVEVDERFDNGNIWHSWIDYTGSTLEVRANQTGVRPEDAMVSMALDLAGILGEDEDEIEAYVGFTAGTGANWITNDILAWEFRDAYDPIGNRVSSVPAPTALILFGSGLAALVGVRRRPL